MCFLRLLILLVIVSLQHLMAKAESQLFIFPLISNLQSSRACHRLRCRFPDKNKPPQEASWISGMNFSLTDLTVVLAPEVFCMAADVLQWPGKEPTAIVGPNRVQMDRWLIWDQHVDRNRVKPGCFCFTLQLLHQCYQLYPGGVPLESACARFITWWGKNCCANQVNTKIQTDALGLFWSQKTYIFLCSSLWRTTGLIFHCF